MSETGHDAPMPREVEEAIRGVAGTETPEQAALTLAAIATRSVAELNKLARAEIDQAPGHARLGVVGRPGQQRPRRRAARRHLPRGGHRAGEGSRLRGPAEPGARAGSGAGGRQAVLAQLALRLLEAVIHLPLLLPDPLHQLRRPLLEGDLGL